MKTDSGTLKSSLPIEKALRSIRPSSKISILPVGRAFDLFQKRYPNQSLFTLDQNIPIPLEVFGCLCDF